MPEYKTLDVTTRDTLTVSSPPHIYGADTINRRMRDVLIALSPACAASLYHFGLNAFFVIGVSVVSAVLAEFLFQKVTNKPVSVNDFSAAITGLLIALNMPPGVPLWIPALGSIIAIIAVKQLFGGLGSNFMNPALAARAILLVSFPMHMTSWIIPGAADTITAATTAASANAADVMTMATPLAVLKENPGFAATVSDYAAQLLGSVGGSLGETSSAALLLGGAYLIYRRVINWRIPVFYIGSFALFAFILGRDGFFYTNVLYEILSGGLLLGALFMATDYATSPITPRGKIIMGIGCGFLTVIIRFYGGYPEGVSYAILIMNIFVPTIDKYVRPRIYGRRKKS